MQPVDEATQVGAIGADRGLAAVSELISEVVEKRFLREWGRRTLPAQPNHPEGGQLEGYAMATGYPRDARSGEPAEAVHESLEALVREGARRMLAMALEAEVNAFLDRDRY